MAGKKKSGPDCDFKPHLKKKKNIYLFEHQICQKKYQNWNILFLI